MSAIQDTICRLCLRVLHKDFTFIEETAIEMLEVLFVKLNFDVSNNPLMCEECVKIIKKSLSFKLVCLGSEKIILWFCTHNNMTNVDLRDVYKHNSKEIVHGDTEIICRFCTKKVKRSSFIPLDDLMKENTFSDMLKVYMFEMDLNIIKNPSICSHCRDNVESYFKFLRNCCDTEKKINTYKQVEGIRSGEKIMLSDVFEKVFECTVKEELCNSIIKIKDEFNTEDKGQNKERSDHKLCMCDLKDSSCFRCLVQSKEDAPDVKDVKIETLEENNEALKTEKLIIKDEVTLSDTTGQQRKVSRICICKPKMYMCGKCNSQFEVVSKGPMVYKCKLCLYQGRSIKPHMLTHQNMLEAQIYQCDSCDYKTKHKDNLKKHLLIHKDSSDLQTYQCDSCEFQTKRKSTLNYHLLIHKDSSDVQMYKCNSCKFGTKHKSSLRSHLLVHKNSDVQMYQCGKCEYQTKYRKNLKSHSLVHKDPSEVQMYQCDSCEFKTKYKGSFRSHLLIHKHSVVKMYRCDSCKYQTNRKRSFKNHQMYQCDSCELQTKQ